MEKNTYRVAALKLLVESDGGPAEFARKRGRADADKPIDPTYVSQVLNGHRSFGEKAASNMEKRAGLKPGYFEQPAGAAEISQEAQEASDIVSSLPLKDRVEIIHWLRVEAIRRRHDAEK